MAEKNDVIERAAANLDQAKTIIAPILNVRDVLKYDRLIVTEEALPVIETLWALSEDKREPSQWKLDRQAVLDAASEPVAEVA